MTASSETASDEGLIGRERELATAMALLEGSRLVTIWGPGGVGKTTLARAVARTSRARAFFVELSEARTALDLNRALSRAFGLAASAAAETASLGEALASLGRVLVVLDDVEHAVGPTAALVTALLAMTSDVRFVVTSRERLRVPGERVLELAPLALPRASSDPADSPAVRLLLARARAARPDFVPDIPSLAAIAERLEGIPLALELAAARMSLLSAQSVLERLGSGVPDLANPPRGAPPRHASLEVVLEDTWVMLDPGERRVLAALSIFAGGCEPEAAEAVLHGLASRGVLATLEALRDKSLVRVTSSLAGGTRLVLLGLVRAFAAAKLEPADAELIAARHASYYVERARVATRDVTHDERALDWLEQEQENLRAIVRGGDADRAAEAALGLAVFYERRGPAIAAVELVDDVLAQRDSIPSALRDALADCAVRALIEIGAMERAAQALEKMPLDYSDPARAVSVALARSQVAYARGELASCRELADRALATARELGFMRERGRALMLLALAAYSEQEIEGAIELLAESADALRSAGDRRTLVRALARIGFLVYDKGDYAGARRHIDEAMVIARELGSPSLEGLLEGYLGNLARGEGRLADATAHYQKAITTLRGAGERRFAPTFEMDLAITELLAGESRRAADHLARVFIAARESGDRLLVALVIAYRVLALADTGDIAAAGIELGDASAVATKDATLFPLAAAFVALAKARGDRAATAQAVAEARARLHENIERARWWEHTRLVSGVLQRAVDRADPPPDALVISDDANQVRLPGTKEPVDLSKRVTLARVLLHLVMRHERRLGAASVADLAEAGWPGERMSVVAAANRVRVAISTLRGLGFDALIERSEHGYALPPSLRIVRQ